MFDDSYIYTADGAFPNPRLTSPTSSVAAARPAPFSSGLLLFALSWIRAAALVLFSFLISPLDSAPHLAFTLILFLGDLEGIRWEQVMRTRQGHQNPLLGMIDWSLQWESLWCFCFPKTKSIFVFSFCPFMVRLMFGFQSSFESDVFSCCQWCIKIARIIGLSHDDQQLSLPLRQTL